MRLSTSLRLSMGVSVAAILGLSLLLAASLRQSRLARESAELASALHGEIAERNFVTEEFLQRGEARPREQWVAKAVRIRQLLAELEARLAGEEAGRIAREMGQEEARCAALFERAVGFEASQVGQDDAATQLAFRRRIGESLRTAGFQLAGQSHLIDHLTSRGFEDRWRKTTILVLATVGSALLVVVWNAVLVSGLIRRRLLVLRDGAARLAAGQLDHRIAVAGADELADLGRDIDAMAARLQQARQALQLEVESRRLAQQQLEAVNQELEAFSYSVSHDLRAPLRSIVGFSQAVLEDYGPRLDDTGRRYLEMACQASQEMGQLIDDLLSLSRVTRTDLAPEHVDLSSLASAAVAELRAGDPGREVAVDIAPGLTARGDPGLLKVLLDNLLRNAWKFTSRHPRATIRVGRTRSRGQEAYFVSDDGAGFDMAYVGKAFQPFQRLHSLAEFPGTGVGLATVRRIARRHGGEAWIEAAVEKGATVFFTLEPGPALATASPGDPPPRPQKQ